MAFYLVVLVTVLTHSSYKGSKVLLSLYALDFGASPVAIGVMFSMYSVFPVFLAVYAGRLSDRFGFRLPMLFGACGLLAGLLLPFFVPRVETLYFSAVIIGACYIFYIVSVQHVIGLFGDGSVRTRNFSLFALGVGLTTFIGPTMTGFAIDAIGHRQTYLLLAALPLMPIVVLTFFGAFLPRPHHTPRAERRDHHIADLVRNAPLRRAFITSGILETGQELFNFFLPIYAHSVGLRASQIGVIMGAYGIALLVIRGAVPMMVRRAGEERVLSASLLLATLTCILFPSVSSFPLLIAMAFLLGLGLGSGAPLSMTLTYGRAPAGRSGEAMGLRQTVNKATEVVMPLIFGTVGAALGTAPVFWVNAAMLGAGSWFMHRDAVRRAGQTAGDGGA